MSAHTVPRGVAAFSLVEVALSMGIVAFALVAIFGLLSVGVNGVRDSGDDTRLGFIMQDVSARVRAEASNLTLPADPTKMDLTWSTIYGSQLSYTILGKTTLPADSTGQPQASATAYYTADGLLVKQSTAAAPTTNYYKASVYIQHLDVYPFSTPSTDDPATIGYPFLAVTVKVGWPTDHAVNGNVLGANNTAKSVFTFYLPRP